MTAKLSNAFQLLEVFIISTLILLCQNVKITGVWTMLTGRELMEIPTVIVITGSALDGSVSRVQPAQECQLHVHLPTDVTLTQPVGWMVDTPQQRTVRSPGRCVFTGIVTAVAGQQTSKLEIVVHIMCTILVVHLVVVLSVIVVLTKHKVQTKYSTYLSKEKIME